MLSKPSLSSSDDLASSSNETDAVLDQSGSLLLGALLITAGFLANTIQGALGKTAQSVIGPGQFLWLLIALALAVLLPIEAVRGGRNFSAGWHRNILLYYLLRAVFGLSGFYLFIWAAGLGSLVNANVLLNTTPVFIPVIGVLALGKEISGKLWGAIAIGFVGLLLVVQPNADLVANPANLLGLGAGLSAAIEFLTIRHLSQTQSPAGLTLYYLLLGSILMAPVALWQWQPLTLETLKIVAAAAGSFLSFQLLLVQAYRYAEPHQIGVFQYSSVIFAAIIGWLFFNEVPNLLAVAGMMLISLGGALSIYLPNSQPD
ncbi:DMT family transporter [cf. Phormidesmis sp. LEGE 11477]|uniref:DMT family transporter n=1 Tax=cf. Phormidesmis sp. LEGE 11477 TaxID=1828680 RepID=UPI001882DA9D|nr:DMT family transporter [cf. Phormidesmis sp. LEGE 11477]MBE9063123.1 DMT family transporter [cf. Phormidesmis sp. LEGE 11477]